MKLTVVVPVFNESAALAELLRRIKAAVEPLDLDWQILLLDDGSRDATWPLIYEAAAADSRIRGIRLSRNFGHQVALSAGLTFADGDAVITLDGDLQHPPELIPELLAKAQEGYDVVFAVRGTADTEGWFKVHSARVFYWLLNRLTALDLPHAGADYRYMSGRVVNALRLMPERHRFLRGMTRWIGYQQATIEYDRSERLGGRSTYTMKRMVSFALDAIISFSAMPLRMVSILGVIVSLLGFVDLAYVLGVRLFEHGAVPGWTSSVVAVLLLGGMQLICIGIIGQYLGHMYDEAKGRPLFLVADDTAATMTPDASVSAAGSNGHVSDDTPPELTPAAMDEAPARAR